MIHPLFLVTTCCHHHIFFILVPSAVAMDPVLDTSGSRSTRISNAKAFLKKNLTKNVIHVDQMLNIEVSTLRSSIASKKKLGCPDLGGHNKILKERQVRAIPSIHSIITYIRYSTVT